MSDAQEIKTERRGGFRAGAGRPKGARNSRPRSKTHSDSIESSKIEKLLAAHYSGEQELSPTQLKAIEIRYSRLKPTLAAIEQTFVDERDAVAPEELRTRLAARFDAKPELLGEVLAIVSDSVLEQALALRSAAKLSAATTGSGGVTH